MHPSPRRNPPKSTTREKGKAINLEPEEEDVDDIPMDGEDVGAEVEEVEARMRTLLLGYGSMSLHASLRPRYQRTSM